MSFSPNAGFDFSEAEEIFAGDPADYLRFLRRILLDMQEAKDELKACMNDFSTTRFRLLRHNLLSTVRVFRLDTIGESLNSAQEVLSADDKAKFLANVEVLNTRISEFETALKGQIESL